MRTELDAPADINNLITSSFLSSQARVNGVFPSYSFKERKKRLYDEKIILKKILQTGKK